MDVVAIALTVLLAAMQVADFVLTRATLRRGGKELNPIARWIIARAGMSGLLVAKLAAGVGGAAVLCWIALQLPVATWLIAALCLLYAWVIHNNWGVLRRQRAGD